MEHYVKIVDKHGHEIVFRDGEKVDIYDVFEGGYGKMETAYHGAWINFMQAGVNDTHHKENLHMEFVCDYSEQTLGKA